jgi:XTP/dITP diphosphohydrolase
LLKIVKMSSSLLLATSNRGKALEYKTLLSPLLEASGLELITVADIPGKYGVLPEPSEDGDTFAANAAIKALHYSGLTGLPALADDSGLRVEALSGAPGVLSARFGGGGLSDAGRCARLLQAMEGVENRSAYFEASVSLAFGKDAPPLFYSGKCQGVIAGQMAGDSGFGYDPIFRPAGSDLTLAQIGIAEKNGMSHRFKAIRALLGDMENVLSFLAMGHVG